MTDQVEDIEVEVDPKIASGEAAPKVEVVAAPETPAAKEPVSPDEGIAALKAKLDQESRLRQQAEQRARETEERLARGQRETQAQGIDGQIHQLTSAREAATNRIELLKQKQVEAYSAGDWKSVSDINAEMARQSTYLTRFEEGLYNLDQAKKNPRPQVQERQPQQQAPADPVEQVARQLSSRSADWIRAHPDFIRDETKYHEMRAAEARARSEGHTVDSDAYFRSIESKLGLGSGEPEAEAPRRQQQVAAPPSRQAPSTSNGKTRVTLTAEERQTAREMGKTDAEWAALKARAMQDGKYTSH